MTDMDEMADEALNGAGRILYGQELKERIAQYLRKAKADGMREAAGIVEQEHGHDLGLRTAADQIEKGQ